jgi:(2Fe-2S) ferredoxin
MAGYRRHVFVCLNERDPSDPKGSCKHRGSEAVFKALKEGAAKAGLRDVRINRAGCMEHCAYGPTVVVYPEAVWYHVPTAVDAKEVLETHVIGGEIVDRLLIEHLE